MKVFRCRRSEKTLSYAILNGELYKLDYDALDALLDYKRLRRISGDPVKADPDAFLRSPEKFGCVLAKPIDPPEVWGTGITYYIARRRYSDEASVARIGELTIYDAVYDAKRPEVFFKGTGNRCVGPNEPVAVRGDSEWTHPEPELALVLSSSGEILGFTIADDVTAGDIESENPLYLPQAKIYRGSCAIGPVIVTPDEVPDPYNLTITLRMLRQGKVLFEGSNSTKNLKRKFEEMIEYLLRYNPIPDGTVYMTGAAVVPGKEYPMLHGDVIEITIDRIGTLVTPVVKL
ncbi:MAG: fumarylacetoacetate hydrolase family protein [Thermoproteus sp. AZ2]|jgi:2-dehydro-3-deoxy-D-arabinonate dehydratase|uniref:Fumarylacetoacetate hydrolase family protein n=1 Tax=Thermoproteus sp. AZ2 TaxID=1609232 RepID=A0ACC6V3X5_9CREN|nr:MAG: fumarylacetoacetate hydrolase [Thermoproteus sp. AZ2]